MKKSLLFVAALLVSAMSFAATKSETVTKEQLVAFNAAAQKYADAAKALDGTAVNYAIACMANKDMPWVQLRVTTTELAAYIKIEAPGKVKKVTLTISNASNSAGGAADITKHGAYTGNILANSEIDAATSIVTAPKEDIVDNEVVLNLGENGAKNVYIQTDKAARIWGWTVEYETTATDIENVVEAPKTFKTIYNGQVVIVRDGVRYNTVGQIVE